MLILKYHQMFMEIQPFHSYLEVVYSHVIVAFATSKTTYYQVLVSVVCFSVIQLAFPLVS